MHTSANTYSFLCICLPKGIQFLSDDGVFTEFLVKKKTQKNKNAVKNSSDGLNDFKLLLRHVCLLREMKSVLVKVEKGVKKQKVT